MNQLPAMKKLLFLLFTLVSATSFAQEDEEEEKPKNYELSGYVKLLGTFNHFNTDFIPPFIPAGTIPGSFEDYQIHNRFDFKYYPTSRLTFGVGMRNRLFWGYRVQNDPTFERSLEDNNGLVDLSFNYWDSQDVMLNTIFDRLWAQWGTEKWNIRLGRQRINWGMNTVWNPNDIFNQYNYLDFDYEERPGTDALRIQFFPNFLSTIEASFSPNKELDQSVAALLYKTNKWNYDFQILSGYYKQDAVFGAGWAGNLKNAGFKGELSYYLPLTDSTKSNFTFSPSLDYQFKNGLYVLFSYLYNGLGTNKLRPTEVLISNSTTMSAKDLFLFKHTLFLSSQYQITPLFQSSIAFMVSPDLSSLIFFPSLTYSVTTDLDALIALQMFATENDLKNDSFQWMSAAIFGRLKYSF